MSFVILDRDGVINHDSREYIKTPDEWLPIPGSLAAIAQLNRHGFRVVVATNQSGIARGYYDIEMLDRIHEKMVELLAAEGGHIDHIFFCPHHPDEKCACRKPQPGMIEQFAMQYSADLTKTYFVGDSLGDMLAAQSKQCRPLLVRTGNGERVLASHPEVQTIPNFANLAEAVDYIISQSVTHHDD